MNMFAVLETLREVGFNGGLQMDHRRTTMMTMDSAQPPPLPWAIQRRLLRTLDE